MSLRACKLGVLVLLCSTGFLGWQCWRLFGQIISADFIERQCVITQDVLDHPPDDYGPADLAERLLFLRGYYDAHIKSLAGSRLEWIVTRDYQRTLTNAVALFRSQTTNDLGSAPDAWILK